MKLPISEFAIDIPIEHMVSQMASEITKQFEEARVPFLEFCKSRVERDFQAMLPGLRVYAEKLAEELVRDQVGVIVSRAVSETVSVSAIKKAVNVTIQEEIAISLAKRSVKKLAKSDDDRPISLLELSLRPNNVLMASGIETIGKLTKMTTFDLLRLKNCGRESVREIKERLQAFGLSLRTD